MAYSTTQDVQTAAGGPAVLVQLADFENATTLDAAALLNIDDAIATADGVIDSYLGKRFAIPIAAPTTVIRKLSARFAVFELRSSRGMLSQVDLDRHATDLEWLEGVAKGIVMPGVDPLPLRSSLEVDHAGERLSTKYVSRNRLKGFW